MKPVVDGLQKQYQGKVEIRRINVEKDANGSSLSAQYNVTAVPTFVFLNKSGAEASRLLGTQSEGTMKKALDALK